jgi:hypothetical protein
MHMQLFYQEILLQVFVSLRSRVSRLEIIHRNYYPLHALLLVETLFFLTRYRNRAAANNPK